MAKNSSLYIVNPYVYFKELLDNFGAKFLTLLTTNYIFVNGIVDNIILWSENLYYRDLNLELTLGGTYAAISVIPWTITGLPATISDIFPIFSHNKTYYLYIYSLIGSAGSLCLLLIPKDFVKDHSWIAPIFFFMMNTQTASFGILFQGKYVQEMKKASQNGVNIIIYVWFVTSIGALVPSFTLGIITEYLDIRYIYLIAFPFAVQSLIIIPLCPLPDDKVPKEKSFKLNQAMFKKQKGIIITTLLAALAIGCVAFVGMFGNSTIQLIYSIVICIAVQTLALFTINQVIAYTMAYKVLTEVLYVNISIALDNYYLADQDCNPNGPNFSESFYRSLSSTIGAFITLLGLVFVQVFMIKMKFHYMMMATTLIRMLASIFDFIIGMRWNVKIGIPDEFVFILGFAVVSKMAYIIDLVTALLLSARLTPKSLEATTLSLVSGFSMFGQTVSRFLGVWLIDILGIKGTEPCNWSNYPILVLIGNLLLPSLLIPLAYVIIPHTTPELNALDVELPIQKLFKSHKKIPKDQNVV